MSPDDPLQLVAFLKNKARHMEDFIEGGTYIQGWIAAAIDADIWTQSPSMREAVAADNAKLGLT